jgi:hypothetical protein
MPVQNDEIPPEPLVRRSWQERLIIPVLITGGILTCAWILALMGMVWRIVGAVAGTPN